MNGTGTFAVTLKTAGTETVTATDTTTAAATGTSGDIAVSAAGISAAGSRLVVSAPSSATAGTACNVTVTAQDIYGNTITGYAGTVQFTSTDGAATHGETALPASTTLASGTGTYVVTLKTAGTRTVTATDTTTATITGTSGSIAVSPAGIAASGSKFAVVSGAASTTAGTPVSVTVTAQDSLGNTITGYAGTVHFTSSDSAAVLPANTTLVNGTGTFAVTLKTAGTKTVTATDTTTAAATGTSGDVTVSPADFASSGSKFGVTAPSTATAGTAFNVTVTAQDAYGNTITTYTGTVHFTSGDGAAVLPANTTLTSGTGTFAVTLKTAGAQTVAAADTVTTAATGTSGDITVSAAGITSTGAKFAVSAPATASAGTAVTVSVTAQDVYGNTITGYTGTVHFTSTDSAAVLPADTTLTSGTGTLTVTLQTAGTKTVTAADTVTTAATGTSDSITVSAADIAFSGSKFVVSAPSTATAGTGFNVTVTAQDNYGNTITGYTGTVHLTSSDNAAFLPADGALTSGTGTFAVTLKTAGTRTVTATDTETSAATGTSGGIAVSAGDITSSGAKFVVSAPSSANSGMSVNVTVTAQDAYGNTITGYAGTVHFTSTDGLAVLPTNTTLTSGAGTFAVTLKTTGTSTMTATDTVTAAVTGISGNIAVNPADITSSGSKFVVSAPATATAGTGFNVTVTAQDSSGNTIMGYAGTVHFTSSDGAAVLPADATLVSGAGTFAVTLKTAGARTVTAADTVTTAATGTSGTIAVSPADVTSPGTKIVLSTTTDPTAGTDISVTVTVEDAYGNTITDYTGTLHFTSSDGSSDLPADVTLTGGTGTFAVKLKTAGTATVTVTDTADPSVTGTLSNIAVSPAGITATGSKFVISAPTGATVGTAFDVTVTAQDACGNTITGYTGPVHVTSSDHAAVLPANTALTSGTGTFTVTLQSAGAQTVVVADAATGAARTTANVTVGKGTPTVLTRPTVGALSYGQTLADAILTGGQGDIQGSFAFTTPSAVPGAGAGTQQVTFTPTDTANYNPYTFTVSVPVSQVTPTLTWATPGVITHGTALSETQLNATASVAGRLVYSPAAGSIPALGTQTLGVTFTPTDTVNYTSATGEVSLVVGAAPSAPAITSVVIGFHEAVVHFTEPAQDGGFVVTLYTVTATPTNLSPTSGTLRALTTRGQGPVAATAPVVVVTGTSSPITVTGLLDGTDYVFTVTASNTLGEGPPSAPSAPQSVAPPTRLSNMSVRIGAGTGDNTLIVGFVVGGAGTSGSKPLLIRGVGPTLATYGVTGTLADPSLALIPQGAGTPLATNDDWAGDAQLTSVGNMVGAFPLSSAASKDAALYLTPASGVYTVQVTGMGGATGIALAEIYDASSTSYNSTTPRLINLSARAQVGTGDGVLIAGFVVEGTASRTVLIRAVGPTLGTYGVGGVLADPQLELTQAINGTNVVVASNDNWAGDAQITSVANTVGAFALSSASSKDAAILVTLPPGIYSAKAAGAAGSTGVALIEVYEVP